MSNVKKVIICILAIALVILAITTNVFASAEPIFEAFLNNNENNNVQNIENRSTNTNTENKVKNVVNNSANNVVNKAVNNNARVSNAEEHADAGVDYSIVFVIAICGISAIYAYKKIRDYNV